MGIGPQPHLIYSVATIPLTEHPDLQVGENEGCQHGWHQHLLPLLRQTFPPHCSVGLWAQPCLFSPPNSLYVVVPFKGLLEPK